MCSSTVRLKQKQGSSDEHVYGGCQQQQAMPLFLKNSLIEEDVVLRTHSQRGTDDIHVSLNVSSINVGGAGCRREEAGQDGPAQRGNTYTACERDVSKQASGSRCEIEPHSRWAAICLDQLWVASSNMIHNDVNVCVHCGGFSRPVVPQEGRDLAFVEIDVETVDGWTGASTEHLHQVLDLNPHHQADGVGLEEQLACMARKKW